MNHRTLPSSVAAACLCLASAAIAAEVEYRNPVLDITQAPAPVRATLWHEGARVSKLQRETEDGQTVYEATVSKGRRNYSLQLTGDGRIVKREPFDNDK